MTHIYYFSKQPNLARSQ